MKTRLHTSPAENLAEGHFILVRDGAGMVFLGKLCTSKLVNDDWMVELVEEHIPVPVKITNPDYVVSLELLNG